MQENAGRSSSANLGVMKMWLHVRPPHIPSPLSARFHCISGSTVYHISLHPISISIPSPVSTTTMNNPAVSNLILSLGAMQGTSSLNSVKNHSSHNAVARKIPMEDPQVVNYLRIGYVSAQLISLAIYYFITLKVSLSWAICGDIH